MVLIPLVMIIRSTSMKLSPTRPGYYFKFLIINLIFKIVIGLFR